MVSWLLLGRKQTGSLPGGHLGKSNHSDGNLRRALGGQNEGKAHELLPSLADPNEADDRSRQPEASSERSRPKQLHQRPSAMEHVKR